MSKRQRKISLTSSSTTRDTLSNVVSSSNDTLFERKIGFVTEGLQSFLVSRLKEVPQENALTIVDYVISMKNEINLSDNYRKLNIYTLYRMSKFFNNKKTYKEFTREDLGTLLNKLGDYNTIKAWNDITKERESRGSTDEE